jgi:hypothetical protein
MLASPWFGRNYLATLQLAQKGPATFSLVDLKVARRPTCGVKPLIALSSSINAPSAVRRPTAKGELA